ncbi:hypothetical protein DUI87_30885 [Hirundo rustica rustica]|uniref:RNase H type-1 domain-containing protein n=1 Tax=Hirundo rustica rustica TaxID=333673 RepID=A0A3M0JCY5_HIRRU|nr:hypothetical protein DUI87_30885 [Hirundo rustica rustica]
MASTDSAARSPARPNALTHTLDPGSDEGTQQLINLFLGQSTGDIRRKLQKIRGPNSRNLETLLDEAWRVFSNREEGYKQGMKKLAAVVKGKKGKRGQSPPKQGPPRLGKDQCTFCKKFGHWKNLCPELRKGDEHTKDLKDAFFCLPLHEASQKIFAFEWESPKTGKETQLTGCVLPQEYKNSPTIFGEQLAKDLESWEPPPGEGQLLQPARVSSIPGESPNGEANSYLPGLRKVSEQDVEIVVTNIVNPASFLSGNMGEPVIHDCLETIEATYSSRPDLKDTLLEDAETWFTDGSRCAFGVVHAHGAIWKERGLLNSQGKSIKHAQEILRLLDAVQLPERVAIMHIKAHQKVSSELEEGNMLADREAKDAAKGEVPDKAVEAALIPDEKIYIEECYIWALNNRTQPLWGGVKNDFFQSFRYGTAVFKSIEFSLGAKDSIILLLVLLCLLCTACTMFRNQTLHGVVQRLLEEEGKRNKCKTTASVSTQTVIEETGTASMQTVTEEKRTKNKATVSASTQTITEEKGTKNKATVSASTQTITEEKGTKNKTTVSVSTQAVTEEKETKSAISISTQTVTEAEQAKPVAVAPVQKKKSKSKSVRIMTDEDVAGPSHPAEETEPEIITRSLSLGELRDLRREFTRQTNESILTWLLRIWDAAANDTILDGSEARQLGSLSRDVVIDQGIGRTQQLSASGGDC